MARITWNDGPAAGTLPPPIEIHYGSPHEFVKEIETGAQPERIFVASDRPLGPGSRREIVLHIGFIDREVRLVGTVEETTSPAESRRTGRPAGMTLRLLGADGRMSLELRNLVQQIQQGLTCEAARGREAPTGERTSRERQVRAMPTTLKLMLAVKAEKEDRAFLINDLDPQVIQYLLKNPRLTLEEVRTIAGRPSAAASHITTIAANPAWNGDEQVKLNLARNPRLPEVLVEPLLNSLSVAHLKIVAASTSTSPKAKRVAHRILHTRSR